MLSAFDARLLERLHGDLPLTDTPFADVAAELGSSEALVLERLQTLLADGTLTRFGPLFQIERAGGLFVLGTETPAQAQAAIERIEADTGLPVLAFPKEREFFVELKLPLTGSAHGLG